MYYFVYYFNYGTYQATYVRQILNQQMVRFTEDVGVTTKTRKLLKLCKNDLTKQHLWDINCLKLSVKVVDKIINKRSINILFMPC